MDWLIDIPEFLKAAGDVPFKIVVLACLYYGVKYGVKEIRMLRESVGELHKAIAVIIERTSSHEKRITRLESRKK